MNVTCTDNLMKVKEIKYVSLMSDEIAWRSTLFLFSSYVSSVFSIFGHVSSHVRIFRDDSQSSIYYNVYTKI